MGKRLKHLTELRAERRSERAERPWCPPIERLRLGVGHPTEASIAKRRRRQERRLREARAGGWA